MNPYDKALQLLLSTMSDVHNSMTIDIDHDEVTVTNRYSRDKFTAGLLAMDAAERENKKMLRDLAADLTGEKPTGDE